MSRHKWYRAKWSASMREMAKKIQQTAFMPEATDGFVLDRARDNEIEARFVEKIDVHQTVTDPFGGAVEFDRIEYRQWRFRLTTLSPGLELLGSTKGSNALAYRLAELSRNELTLSNLNINVLSWLARFQEIGGYHGFIDAMQVGNINLGQSVKARAIVRGREDVKSYVADFLAHNPHDIEKVQFKISGRDRRTISLSNSAGCVITGGGSEPIIDDLRKSLEHVAT
ncbi:hypothetical protein MKK55_07535 [Methylobacterium sp. J-059]|uniref:hypothetical protein n=1 Tax=Methylobacterium sp. J-059 TaxID=2836643 RepID=UPI001FB9F055|nr:hypothetical protein [Methylobacterium sp. J-059]MCJ2038807.1 hypothetical protein [Methylobacterium sp. J-059]